MAEHVQAVLDRMVVGLVDMQQRGVLNAEEVTAVVARRRQSEYALRRRTPRQTDFLHYIAAETTLLRLVQLRERHLRREAFQNKDTTSRENPENDEGDDDDDDDNNKTSNNNDNSNKRTTPHVLRDLHLLWVRTLRKYRSQIDLYFQYAAFCKEQKSFTRLAACYQEAIRFHARCVPLWIEAASHEYFTNQSIQAARILLQRAIRIHKAHPQLWLQRFVLELHAAQKLKGRRRILRGPGDDTTTIPESSNEITTRDDKSINRDKPEDRDDHDDDYKIARLVFDHAVASVGGGGKTQSSNNNEDNVDWRLGCLRHCSQFPDTQGLEWHIVQSLRQQDCEQSPTAWIACAIYQQQKQQHSQNEEPANGTLAKRGRPSTPTNDDDDNEEVLEIIQQACKMVQTDEMLVQAVQFLQSYASHGGNDDDESEKEQSGGALVENRAEETHAVIRSLFANAKTSKIYNARVALRHAEYLMSLDNDNDDNITYAILVLSDYVQNHQEDRLRGRIPAALWIQWACLEYQCSNQNAKKAIEILKRASDSIPMHNKDHWSVLVQLFCLRVASISSNEEELDKLSDLFQQVLMLAPAHSYDVGQAIVEAIPNHPMACRLYLQHIREMRGLTAFRKACDCILVSAAFEKHWVVHHTEALRILLEDIIAVEQEETQHGKQRLGRIYGTAIRSFKGHFAELAEEYRSRKADDVDYNW